MNNKTKGYILATIAAATYGMNPLFALPLYADGVDTDSVLFFRYLFAIIILAAMIKLRGRSFRIEKKHILPLLAMGFVLGMSSVTLFQSYKYMDAGIASTILFVYPIIVAVIMMLFFKEKLTLTTVIGLLLTLTGIFLLYEGEPGEKLSTVGILFVLGSSLSYALYIVGVNQSSLKDLATLTLTFYVLFVGLFIFLWQVDFGMTLDTPTQWYGWLFLLALAVFPTIISFGCTTQAIQYIGSTPTAILGALEPVTALLVGITIFSEQLNTREWCGVIVIIAAVTVVVAEDKISNPLLRFRKMFPKIRTNK